MYIDLILLNIWILVLLEGYVNSFTRFFMLMTFDECDYVLLLAFFSVFCFLWFYRHKIILNSFDLIYNKKRKCFIAIRMSVTYHNKLGSEKCLTHGSTVFCSSRGILWKISYVFHPIRIVSYFFFIWIFFHDHSRITGLQGKKEDIFLSPLYHLHPLHRHLHINQAITAESSSLYRAGNQTWTGNPLFP